jgi:hypothetical protein
MLRRRRLRRLLLARLLKHRIEERGGGEEDDEDDGEEEGGDEERRLIPWAGRYRNGPAPSYPSSRPRVPSLRPDRAIRAIRAVWLFRRTWLAVGLWHFRLRLWCACRPVRTAAGGASIGAATTDGGLAAMP